MINLHLILLGLILLTELFFFWLNVTNLKYGEKKVEEEQEWLTEKFSVESTDDLLAYNRLKMGFSEIKSYVGLFFLLFILYSGVLTGSGIFTDFVKFVESLNYSAPLRGIVFFGILTVITTVLKAPFSAFNSFVIEEIFDFNTRGVGLWLKDQLKGLVIGLVMMVLITGTLLWFIDYFEQTWWLIGWGFIVLLGLAMQIIYPRVIAPLFNDFEQVEEGELYEAVEEVFARAGFECSQVYTMDASTRSRHSNAYFVGFGKTKRVVLYDTLVDQMELDQLQAVLAHELAHWKKGHIWKGILRSALKNGIVFYILFYLLNSSWIYGMFNLPETAVYAGLVISFLWLSPVFRWLSPLDNYFSVENEKEADSFALEVTGGAEPMIGALYRLVGENLSNPFPHPLYAVFNYSHPPVPERIRLLKEQEENNQKL
ncbi:MAG: M48 family metallopeptidase [bacterium]